MEKLCRNGIYLGERRVLSEIPNAIGYHRIVETSENGFLVRQYIHSSLYDRMRCVQLSYVLRILHYFFQDSIWLQIRSCLALSCFSQDLLSDHQQYAAFLGGH